MEGNQKLWAPIRCVNLYRKLSSFCSKGGRSSKDGQYRPNWLYIFLLFDGFRVSKITSLELNISTSLDCNN